MFIGFKPESKLIVNFYKKTSFITRLRITRFLCGCPLTPPPSLFPLPAHDKVRASSGVPGQHGGDAAPLPAGGAQLAAVLLGSGHRHHPGRRDGFGKDGPDRRLPLLAV